jgi:hypothetical protein
MCWRNLPPYPEDWHGIPSKCRYLFTRQHDVACQKILILTVHAVHTYSGDDEILCSSETRSAPSPSHNISQVQSSSYHHDAFNSHFNIILHPCQPKFVLLLLHILLLSLNPMNSELHLNNTQISVPASQRTHCISITQTNQLLLFREIIALIWEPHETHKYTVWAAWSF